MAATAPYCSVEDLANNSPVTPYPTMSDWADSLNQTINAILSSLIPVEQKRMSDFFKFKCTSTPFSAVFDSYWNGHTHTKANELCILILLRKNKVGEDYGILADRLSTMSKKINPIAYRFKTSLNLFKANKIHGAALCKVVLYDALVRGRLNDAVIFVRFLADSNLKIGSAKYLAKRWIANRRDQLDKALYFDDPSSFSLDSFDQDNSLLRDYLLYYLGKTLVKKSRFVYDTCVGAIKNRDLRAKLLKIISIQDNPHKKTKDVESSKYHAKKWIKHNGYDLSGDHGLDDEVRDWMLYDRGKQSLEKNPDIFNDCLGKIKSDDIKLKLLRNMSTKSNAKRLVKHYHYQFHDIVKIGRRNFELQEFMFYYLAKASLGKNPRLFNDCLDNLISVPLIKKLQTATHTGPKI